MGDLVKTTDMSLADIKMTAECIVESKLFPQWDTVPKLMTLMLLCKSEGIDPIQATNRYDNIKGRVSKKSQAILGDFISAGGKVKWDDSVDEKEIARGTFTPPNGGEPHTETFTMDDARRAGLVKPDSGWQKYPKAMLRARCITFALRAVYPQAMNMMLSTEEAQDITPPVIGDSSGYSDVAHTSTPIITDDATETRDSASTDVVEAEIIGEETEQVPVMEWLHNFDQKKVNAFLKSINWGTVSKLSKANLDTIDKNRKSFEEKINAMEE